MSGTVMRIKNEEESRNSAARSLSRTAGRENHTGIPTQLKERVEQSTGMSLDDVRVHYNSILPAKLDALAYTKGNQVEISPGQEQHLPHELGHVIQQKLGAVRANTWHSSGVAMNTDIALERQADKIGVGKRVDIVQRMFHNSDEEEDPFAGFQFFSDAGHNQKKSTPDLRETKDVLNIASLQSMTREQIIDTCKKLGWSVSGGKKVVDNKEKNFVHIKDSENNMRLRIDPPDGVTEFDHVHVYNRAGELLNIKGEPVPENNEDGHIRILSA